MPLALAAADDMTMRLKVPSLLSVALAGKINDNGRS